MRHGRFCCRPRRRLARFPAGVLLSYSNEAFSYTSSPAQQAVVRTRFSQFDFYQHTGADCIAQAFVNPRAVGKNAGLYYNDYNIEADPAKLQTSMGMPDNFKARSVPVTGVGFRMHM